MWPRVLSHWEATVTMIFGGFMSGATPLGGGAVAFPVFTKALQVPPEVARSFALFIQTVSMGVTSAIIFLTRRKVDLRSLALAAPAGVLGLLAGLFVLSDPGTLFWRPVIPYGYVKVTFTVILAAMAYIVWLSLEQDKTGETEIPTRNARVSSGIVIACLVGGLAAALTGSGVNVFLFLFLVVMAELHPRVGIPTSIVAMAVTSATGLLILGLADGQLIVEVNGVGDVTSVGGQMISPALPGGQYDLLGLWLAAVPIVAWGAPLGSWVINRLRERRLIVFVASMAALEVITTVLFLGDLRTDPALVIYFLAVGAGTLLTVRWLAKNRRRLLRIEHSGKGAQ